MTPCPQCQSPSKVLETRQSPSKGTTRRRLACTSCGLRFSTWGDAAYIVPEVDQRLDADGMPTYTQAIQTLEALVRSAGGCATIDQVAVVKAWRLLDRFKARQSA
jgi:transcriptional regulator NrdR family protein